MAQSPTLTADFIPLNDAVFVSYGRDRDTGLDLKANDPSIVLLLGWMNAPKPLLFKYAHVHRSIYPFTTILVVETPPSNMWSTPQQRESKLEPVADMLMSKIYGGEEDDSENSGLLIHAISNGGCAQLLILASILEKRHEILLNSPRHNKIPIALVVDSAPGITGLMSMLSSFAASTQSPTFKFDLSFPLAVIFIAYFRLRETFSREPFMPGVEKFLGQPKIVPLANKATPRLYIYSDTDQITPMQRVEEHLAALTREGYNSTAEKYSGSVHVSHMKKDPTRYWEAVRRTWDNAVALIAIENAGSATSGNSMTKSKAKL